MTRPRCLLMLVLALCGSGLGGCAHMDPPHELTPRPSQTPLFQVPQTTSITSVPVASTPYHELPQPPAPQSAPAPVPSTPSTPTAIDAASPSPLPNTPAIPPTHEQQNYYQVPSDGDGSTANKSVKDAPAVEAFRCLMNSKPADAVLLLQSYSKSNQELLLTLLTVAASLSEAAAKADDTQKTMSANVQALEQCIDDLRRHAALRFDKVCFCQWIDKFGVYEPLPDGHAFLPGSQVHVYVELRNFASEHKGHGFETRLASRVKILDSQGNLVPGCEWSFNDRNRPEHSLSLRHDYFINYTLPLPRTMPPGHYKLVLHVDDLPTHRCSEQPMDLILTTRPMAAN